VSARRAAALVAAILATAHSANALARPHLVVTPASSFADQPVHIRVTGLRPGTRAQIRLTMKDARRKLWESSATFRVDGKGTVDLDRAAPRFGSYSGRWGMGLFATLDRDARSLDFFRWKKGAAHTFRVGVRVKRKRVAARAFRRAMPAVTEQPLSRGDAGFVGRYYTRQGPTGQMPGVLAFGGSEGGQLFPPLPRILAANGYPTLGLAYFGAPGVPPTLANVPLEYFEKALVWLRAQPQVDPNRIVVLGISRGSEAAQLLGINYPALVDAVVAGVPSNVAICGFPDCSFPAWTFQGQPVPFTRQFDNTMPTDDPNAVLADERIQGPVFLVCGGADSIWISCLYQSESLRRLALFGHPYQDEAHRYRQAGHGVGALLPYLIVAPNDAYLKAADEQAREAVWPKLLAFLGRS
jgi:dienelactone hydrolase